MTKIISHYCPYQCDQMVRLFFHIWPFEAMKISPIMWHICQSMLSNSPNKKWTVKILPSTCRHFQSGEFLPNLVTLVPTNPGWLRYKLPLNGCLKSLGYSVTSMSLNNIQCAIWLAVVRTRDSSRPIRPQQISGSSSTRLRRRWSEVVSSAWCRSTPSSSRWRTLQTCRPVTT